MSGLPYPDQQPIVFPETMDAFIDRRCAEIKGEFTIRFGLIRQLVERQFHEVTKYVNRSFAQRKRFHRERFANNGTINRRNRMATSKVPMSKAMSIPMTACVSSQISAYGYDVASGTLAMRFHNKGGISDTYHYKISPEQFEELEKAESKGRFFGSNIKHLDCMRLVPDEQVEKAAE